MLQLIMSFQAWHSMRRHDERGATMVEYGLMVALIAIVVAVAAATLGTNIFNLFNDTATTVGHATPPTTVP